MLSIGINAIIFLHVRHDVVQEILSELIDRRTRTRLPAAARAKTGSAGVTGGHHHYHGLRLSGGDEVVENEAGAADRGPGFVTITGAVQQVEDGKLAFAGFVSRRRVNAHAAKLA